MLLKSLFYLAQSKSAVTNARKETIVKVKMPITVLVVRFILTECHTIQHTQIYRKHAGIYIFPDNAKFLLPHSNFLFYYRKHKTILPTKNVVM